MSLSVSVNDHDQYVYTQQHKYESESRPDFDDGLLITRAHWRGFTSWARDPDGESC